MAKTKKSKILKSEEQNPGTITTQNISSVVKNIKEKHQAFPYKATIKILGKVYQSTGVSVKEAIENLKPLGTAKGMALLTISKDNITKEKVIPNFFVMRLFGGSKLGREIAIKNTSLLFNI